MSNIFDAWQKAEGGGGDGDYSSAGAGVELGATTSPAVVDLLKKIQRPPQSAMKSTTSSISVAKISTNPFAPVPQVSNISSPLAKSISKGSFSSFAPSSPFAQASQVPQGSSGMSEEIFSDPLLSLQRLDFPTHRARKSLIGQAGWSIVAAEAAGGYIFFGTSDGRLIYWKPSEGIRSTEVDVVSRPSSSDIRQSNSWPTIRNIFADPTGSYVLVTLHTPETYYVDCRSNKAQKLTKWENIYVTSIAFEHELSTKASTKSILLGSMDGSIYEVLIDHSGKDRTPSKVHQLELHMGQNGNRTGKFGGNGCGITALEFIELPTTAPSISSNQLVALAVTISYPTTTALSGVTTEATVHFHTFWGPVSAGFESLFRHSREEKPGFFQELVGGVLPSGAELHIYKEGEKKTLGGEKRRSSSIVHQKQLGINKNGSGAMGLRYAVLTGVGIYHGKLDPLNKDVGGGALQPYPNTTRGVTIIPHSMMVTEHHFLLLYPERLVALSCLTGHVAAEAEMDVQWGNILRILPCKWWLEGERSGGPDQQSPLWLVTDRYPIQIVLSKEGRNVWIAYLEKAVKAADVASSEAFLDLAQQHCSNAYEKGIARHVQAGWLFRKGDNIMAAKLYATSVGAPFEEIALRFLSAGLDHALRVYVSECLENAPLVHKMQRTMLSTLLVQLYLQALAEGEETKQKQLNAELANCLTRHVDSLDSCTTASMLTAHGRFDELLLYVEAGGDYERAVAHHIAQGPNYSAALNILHKAPFDKAEPLIYRYSAVLVDADPEGTIKMWIEKPELKPTKLIPALVRYSKHRRHSGKPSAVGPDWAVTYLEHCIDTHKVQEPAIHNHLLALYAEQEKDREMEKQKKERGEEGGSSSYSLEVLEISPLLKFLSRPPNQRCFDVKYALRVCSQLGLQAACVKIYSSMGLFEEAVELALKVDPALARADASMPSNPEVRKRLWLQIARHEIQREAAEEKTEGLTERRGAERTTTPRALSILNECDLLKIEDILPFFPPFSIVASFKEEICKSLEDHKTRIEGLRAEMEEYTESVDAIQAEIKSLRERTLKISNIQPCEECYERAVSQECYVFPCGHAFHSECLFRALRPYLSLEQVKRVTELLDQLGRKNLSSGEVQDVTDNARATRFKSSLQMELDSLLAADCPLCGEVMIGSIDKPLGRDDGEEERLRWKV
eukprot:277728_1